MRRGDLVTVAMPGDFGKPRPALIIQSDRYTDTATLTVLLVSSTIVEADWIRVTVAPKPENGLRSTSQVLIDKTMTAPRAKLQGPFGRLDDDTLQTVDEALAVFLDIA